MEFKVCNLSVQNQENSKLMATAAVSFNGIKVMGWKLTKNLNDQMVVYPPSTKKNNGYKQVVELMWRPWNKLRKRL